MARDPEYLAFARAVDAGIAAEGPQTIPQQRANHTFHMGNLPRLPVALVQDLTVAGGDGPLAARLYHPAPGRSVPGWVFFHGGGFHLGTVDAYDAVARVLVDATGWALVSVDYRLAPEHRFPAALRDSLAATRDVLARADELGLAAVGVAGDSAGANLAAVVARHVRPLAAQLLVYGVYDLTTEPELPVDPDGLSLTGGDWDATVGRYLGTGDAADPDASPLLAADLGGLPPAVVATAEYDNLRAQGQAYADRLRACGVPVRYVEGAGLDHAFLAWGPFAQRARDGIAAIAAAVRELLP